MAPRRLETLPPEILGLIVSVFSTTPARPLSEYYVAPQTSPVVMTRVATYAQGIRSLKNICLLSKKFLGIGRYYLYSNIIIFGHSMVFLLFRTMILVPDLAKRVRTLESTIALDEQTGPYFAPVLNTNPLLLAHYYNGIHNGMSGVDFVRVRLAFAFMSDWVFDQRALLSLPTPSNVFFIGVLALVPNLSTLLIQYPSYLCEPPRVSAAEAAAAQALIAGLRVLVAGRAELLCTASMNNANGQGLAPLQKLETVRFRRFLRKAEEDAPNDVPEWVSCLLKLPQVTSFEIAGLCDPQLNPAVPREQVLPNGLRGILSHPQVSNLTRLDLAFDVYRATPVKTWLSPLLFGLRATLKHLSVTFLGVINGYGHLSSRGRLGELRGEMEHDRIYSLPMLHNLEHLEVDLHSLFGWARIWSKPDGELLRAYPQRVNSLRARDTIPTTSLKSLHVIESFVDLEIYLNIGAAGGTTGPGYVNGRLALHNRLVGPEWNQEDFDILAAARRKSLTHVVGDLLELVQHGAFPSLRKFFYTPITHARWTFGTGHDDSLLKLAQIFAVHGVEMQVVYAGRLGRICQ